jgi:hypothetical protein
MIPNNVVRLRGQSQLVSDPHRTHLDASTANAGRLLDFVPESSSAAKPMWSSAGAFNVRLRAASCRQPRGPQTGMWLR